MTTSFPVVRTITDNQLRDLPVDPTELQSAIEFHLKFLREAQRIDISYGDHCSMLTNQFRRADMLADAIKSGEKACMIFEEFGEPRKLLIAKIRLATAHQWTGAYAQANQIFQSCFDDILKNKDLESHLDFVWQHFGKCQFDQGKFSDALDSFERALELRKTGKDPELIESTETALKQTLARMDDRILH